MKKLIKNYVPVIAVILIMLYMLIAPNVCIEGAKNGLLLWFNKVLPSLLPFIILTNILSQLGVVFKISHVASPLTKRLFGLPGISFFVFVMGLVAGYPMGAKLTNQLLENKQLSLDEAQKTLCFCNNCGPLFIIGTVGTTMLKSPNLGYFLVIVHFLSAFLLGLVANHYQPNDTPIRKPSALQPFHAKPFSTIFNTSVQNAMDTIVYVGGYIIFFSVIAAILQSSSFVITLLSNFSMRLHIAPEIMLSAVIGSLELSTGTAFLCGHTQIGLYSLALISAILAFGGFCVFFQSSYVLQSSKLSLKLYLFSKLTQALIAFSLTCILYPLIFSVTAPTSLLFWLIILACIFILASFMFHTLSIQKKHNKLTSRSLLKNSKI
ncbi:MAG: nucleoside recognition domain-containing protein [Cellulosilyticaceae bacterium]